MQSRSAALAATSVASFLVPFMMSAVGVALPTIQTELGASAVELSWVVGSYVLSLVTVLVPIGRLADMFGRKRTFVWGTAVFSLCSLCASLVWSVESLVALRVLQGVGAAMTQPSAVAIITEIFPRAERGRAMGIQVASVYLGLSVGPVIGGWITALVGWRCIFLLCLPLGLVAWRMTSRIEGEWRPARGETFDLPGALLYAAFVLCCINGLTHLDRPVLGLSLLGAAVACGVMFFRRSRRVAHPLLHLGLFTDNRVFALSSLATLINYAGVFAAGFLLSLYLQVVRGFSPAQAGLVLVIQPVVQAMLSPLIGALADRFDAARLASLGMAVCVLGLGVLYGVNAATGLWVIGAILVVQGVGFALFASPNMTVIMSGVTPRHYSIASSLVATMRTFGMSLSMALTTVVFGIFLHNRPVAVETTTEFLAAMHLLFALGGGLCVAGVLCSLARNKAAA